MNFRASPLTTISDRQQMGALTAVLIEMIVSICRKPAMCCELPCIPNAMYNLGETVFPDWPTCMRRGAIP